MKLLLALLLSFPLFPSLGQIGYDIKPLKLDKYDRLMKGPKGFTPIKLSQEDINSINQYVLEHEVNFDPSTTIVNDTVSCHYKGEYLWFPQKQNYVHQPYYTRFDYDTDSIEYMSPWVSNADYQLFRDYVRDSLMRKKLAEEDYDPQKWCRIEGYDGEDIINNYDPKYEYMRAPPGSDDPNQSKYSKRDILASFLYTDRDRAGGPFQLDQRKLVYLFYWIDMSYANPKPKIKEHPFTTDPIVDSLGMNKINKKGQNGAIRGHTDRSRFIISEVIPVLRDTGFWYRTNLPENYQEWLTENYTTLQDYQNMPVLGLTGYQAWAFCKWKEQVFGAVSRSKKNPYLIPSFTVDLPRKAHVDQANTELPKLTIPEVNNAWWRITNEDYKAFVLAVQDSIVRTQMAEHFDEDIFYDPTYNVDGNKNDTNDWTLNPYLARSSFYNFSDTAYYQDFCFRYIILDTQFWTTQYIINPRLLRFEYDWYDYKRANQLGQYKARKMIFDEKKYGTKMPEISVYDVVSVDSIGDVKGKDLNFCCFNKLGNGPGVRSHEDRRRFVWTEKLNIYPYDVEIGFELYDFDSCPECLVSKITWHQAKAYYSWYINKRRGHQKMTKKNPTGKMKPTQEQWEKIMKGETIVLPAKEMELPVPAFRYVIR